MARIVADTTPPIELATRARLQAGRPHDRLLTGVHRLASRARSIASLRRLFGRWREVTARVEDRWRGITTEALLVPEFATPRRDAHLYVPLAYGQTRRVLRALRPGPEDVIADVGCGLGRVVAIAAQLKVSHVIGVENDADMADMARANIQTLRSRRSPVEIITGDAATADLSRVTMLILFNPFGPSTMRAMLDRLGTSLTENPRVVRIAYVNPTAEQELEGCQWLKRTATRSSVRFRHTVTLWQSR